MQLSRDGLITIVGMRGSGKTTVARSIVQELGKDRPLLILDPWGEYEALAEHWCFTSADLADKLLQGHRRIRLVSANPEGAADMLSLAWELDGALIVLDEADLLLKTQHNPECFDSILAYGRHFGQSMIVVARRIAELPRGFTAQSTIIFSRVQEPRDVQYFKARLGQNPPDLAQYQWAVHSREGELVILAADWTRKGLSN